MGASQSRQAYLRSKILMHEGKKKVSDHANKERYGSFRKFANIGKLCRVLHQQLWTKCRPRYQNEQVCQNGKKEPRPNRLSICHNRPQKFGCVLRHKTTLDRSSLVPYVPYAKSWDQKRGEGMPVLLLLPGGRRLTDDNVCAIKVIASMLEQRKPYFSNKKSALPTEKSKHLR